MYKKIKSLFFDIDGTLVSFSTHKIPDSTIQALTKAKANGVGIYISTGRPFSIIKNLGAIEHLIDGYITTNGALCSIGKEIVCCNPIQEESVRILLDDALKYDYPCMVIGEKSFSIFNSKEIVDIIFREQLGVNNMDDCRPTEEVMKQRILQLTPFFGVEHEHVLMDQLPYCQSGRWHPDFLDITSVKADKGQGLAAMAQRLGIDIAETIAFGDGGNDISILKSAGIGVAMGNANDNVKAVADYVTTSVDEDGISNALVHFGVI